MAYNYVAYDLEGGRRAGILSVDTEQAAEQLLWRANLTVVSLHKQPKPLSAALYEGLPSFFAPKPRDLVELARGLATLLEAGISLLPAIRFVSQRVRSPLLVHALGNVIVDIESGASFSEAIAKYPSIFPSLFIRLAATSEQTGQLGPALVKAAEHIERGAAASSKVRRALAYPAVVTVVAIGAAMVMLLFAIPAMSGLFQEFGGDLPFTTRILINSSDFARHYGLALGLGFLVAGAIGWDYFFKTPRGREKWDRLLLSLPIAGNVVRYSNAARICGSLGTLLSAGLPILESMDLTTDVVTNNTAKQAIRQITQEIIAGEELSKAMAKHDIFPSLVPQMVNMGEQSGNLAKNLETAAHFFERELDVALSTMTSMIAPTMTLLMGGGVGFIAIAMMSAMYGLIDTIK